MDRLRGRRIVLLYHRIARIEPDPWSLCVTPEHFAEHLDVLRAWRRVRLDQVESCGSRMGNGRLSVAITFDDGYADNLHEAARLLMRSDTPATFFLATGYIGGTREFWWDELERIVFHTTGIRAPFYDSSAEVKLACDPNAAKLSTYFEIYKKLQPLDHNNRQRILDRLLEWSGLMAKGRESHRALNVEEVIKLRSGGLFEIGAHTITHPLLAAQPLESQYEELSESKAWLENLLGNHVASFSYPYGGSGHYTPQTVRAVVDSGFVRACSTSAHPVDRNDGPYELPRFNVTDMNGEQFERVLFS
jgi:peptidoglycan/xylan/chitin deacetylase (PgdA/CDA1 family)